MMYLKDTIRVVARNDTFRTIRFMEWTDRAQARMRELGLRQEDLKETLGVKTRGAVGHYFRGRRQLSAQQIAALAGKLRMSIDELFSDVPAKGAEDQKASPSSVIRLTERESQPERLDPWILAATHRAMRELHAEQGLPYNLEDDPVHFLQAYGLHTELARLAPAGADLVKIFRAAGLANRQGADDGRLGDGAAGMPDEGGHEGKMARKVQRKKA